jgi:hypothetical protein
MIAIAIILSLAFIGWIIYRAVRKKEIKAHLVMYGLASLAGIFTLAFFLSMDIPIIVKILVCIVLGAIFIFLAAYLQRRKQPIKS